MALPTLSPRTGDVANDPLSLIGWLDRLYNYVKALALGATINSPVATTSGTTCDLTGIPSNAKEVTVQLLGVSWNATDQIRIQLGAGSIETSGYAGSQSFLGVSGTACAALGGTGFDGTSGYVAATTFTGKIVFTIENAANNTWICDARIAASTPNILLIVGSKSLSGSLDRARITTVGASTFDAGEIVLSYRS